MRVTRTDARRIAELAHLELEPDELERVTGELNRILEHVVALAELELPDVSEVTTPAGALPSTRAAEAEGPDAAVRGPAAAAPDWRDGFFVVPALPGLSDETGQEGA